MTDGKLKIMNNRWKIILVLSIMVLGLSACKSSNGHCDAYGNKSGSVKH
jgi:hypothetical protein